MIEISNLQKYYGDVNVLDNINLKIKKGSIYGLLGISGAGKSTLLRCINGLETYQSGSVRVNGVEVKNLDLNELREFRKNIGMIFQHFSLLEREDVYNNIALPMKCWGYKKDDIDNKVKELLRLVELSDKIYYKPRQLSGGQKQRVAIARALALNPEILLCDEATSALDPNITNSILNLLKKINKELGITIVVVTHQMNVVKHICNEMTILSKGKLKAIGKVEDIFIERPKVLEELLGDSEYKYELEDGLNIEILNRDNSKNKKILSELAIETNIKYSLVYGGLDKYRDKILGIFVINIDKDDEIKIIEFLNKKNIEWRKI